MKYVFGKFVGFVEGLATAVLLGWSVVGLAYVRADMKNGKIKTETDMAKATTEKITGMDKLN